MYSKSVCLALLIWFVLFEGLAEGEEGSGVRPDNSRGKEQVEESTTDERNKLETTSLDWNEVYTAVEAFVREYELRHHVTIVEHTLDERIRRFDGSYFSSGIMQLNYSFVEKGGPRSSSALLKIPQLGPMYNHAREMLYYAKERYMYEEVIPLLYERVPYESPAPNFYASTDSGIVVLENLRESGYRDKPKGTLLNLWPCRAVWKTLAQFHALSTLHLERISARLNSLSIMNRSEDEWSTKIFPALVKKLRNRVLPSCSQRVNKMFDDTCKDAGNVTNSGFHPNPNGLNVLLHGDAHLSNILLREDRKYVDIKAKFVDFQESRLGSPIIDLVYFAVTSVHFKVFDAHRDELFSLYVREFNGTLERLGVPNENPYTLESIHADFRRYKAFFFLQLCALVPSFWTGDIDVDAVDESSNEETPIEALLKSEKYISAFKGWAKHLM